MGAGKSGSNAMLSLLLLVIAGGAGGYNYHRNLQAEIEEEGPRRFEQYSDADLETLAAAYQAEIDQYQQLADSARAKPTTVRDRGLISDRVREFERVQATGDRQRDLRGQVYERQGQLAEIQREQQLREPGTQGLALHLKRLLTI